VKSPALQVTRDAALRCQDGGSLDAFRQTRMNEHARQQFISWVREHGAQRHGTGALVDRDFRELQRPGSE
jgi:hypothetical protein